MARIGYILRSYPRLSQTFIVNEVWALEQLGLKLHIFAIANPREPIVQPQVAAVRAPVDYLEAATGRSKTAILAEHLWALARAPRRYVETLWYVARRPAIDEGYSTSSRYTCFAQAVYLARLLWRERQAGRAIGHLHAHFAHDPALIAFLTHMLTGISYSFTAHARDLYQVPEAALADRLAAARAVVTCCGANIGYLDRLVPERERGKTQLIHHGVDLRAFQPFSESTNGHEAIPRSEQEELPALRQNPASEGLGGRRPPRDDFLPAGGGEAATSGEKQSSWRASPSTPPDFGGTLEELVRETVASFPDSTTVEPPLILSVGRLVEKKGFPDLLRACEQLKQTGHRFRCVIYGDGPLRAELEALIERLDLAGDVTLAGACSQQELLPALRRAAIFALAPFVADDGDRDGIPNVLVEAMACGLPVVTTAAAGIPELVRHDHNGLLSAPRDVDGLAAALAAVLDDPARRERLGTAARRTAVEHFDLWAGARRIAALFGQAEGAL